MTDSVMEIGDTVETRIAGKNGGTLTPFDPNRARAASRKRWDTAERAVRRAIQLETGAGHWAGGLIDLARVQASIAKAGGQGSTQAYNAVIRSAGLLRERDSVAHGADGGGLTVTMGADVARDLLAMVRERMSK